jgi:hypothetical protein
MAKLHEPADFYQGDEWLIDGLLHDALGNPFNLAGCGVAWRLEDAAGNVVLDLNLSNGVQIMGSAANGEILITVAPSVSATIPPSAPSATPPVVYRDQLRVIDAAGNPSTQWVGPIGVKKSFFV